MLRKVILFLFISAGCHGQQAVYFALNSSELSTEAKITLNDVLKDKSHPVKLQGFADKTGSVAYNRKLATKRMNAVKDYLFSGRFPANLIDLSCQDEPLYDEKLPDNLNRKVTLNSVLLNTKKTEIDIEVSADESKEFMLSQPYAGSDANKKTSLFMIQLYIYAPVGAIDSCSYYRVKAKRQSKRIYFDEKIPLLDVTYRDLSIERTIASEYDTTEDSYVWKFPVLTGEIFIGVLQCGTYPTTRVVFNAHLPPEAHDVKLIGPLWTLMLEKNTVEGQDEYHHLFGNPGIPFKRSDLDGTFFSATVKDSVYVYRIEDFTEVWNKTDSDQIYYESNFRPIYKEKTATDLNPAKRKRGFWAWLKRVFDGKE